MNLAKLTIKNSFCRKLLAGIMVSATAICSFASLGDGNKKNTSRSKNTFLSSRTAINTGRFSLKSGYSFRGNQVLNSSADKKYFNLNTVVSLQRGSSIYAIPLKKKVVIDKVKIEIGNRQFKRN